MALLALSLLSFIFILIPLPSETWHTVFGLIFVTIQSQLLGWKFFRYKHAWFRWLLGFWLLISLIIITGTLFFYGYNLTQTSLYLISLSLPLALLIPAKAPKLAEQANSSSSSIKEYMISILLILVYLLLAGLTLTTLIQHQTFEAVQSPWLLVPRSVFVYYFFSSLILIILHITTSRFRALVSGLHFLLSFSVTMLLYPLGFGFDPFIHQATEQIIATTGTLSPKPFYYIGHYSLVVWLSQMIGLSLRTIDSWLVPILAALSLPTIIYQSLKENFHNQSRVTQLLPLIFLTIPFGALIQSTPQALSVLVSLVILFFGLFYINRQGVGLIYILILAIATLAIHPLSGIPVVFFTILLGLYHRFWHRRGLSKYVRIIGYSSLTALAAIILPLTFFLNSYLSRASTTAISTATTETASSSDIISGSYQAFVRFEDIIYLLGNNTRLIIVLLSAISILFMIQKKRLHYFLHYLITFFVLVINYILLKSFVSFDFLIPYERFIFPERILQLSFYFLLPFVFVTGYLILRRVVQLTPLLQAICWLMFAGSMTISWYLSYPRFDFFEQNKGFNTSRYDLQTVQWIHDQETESVDYVVLANQSVSAAAIQQYGFYRYYGRNFYYPIPTGDPLYQSYLDLVNNRKEQSVILQDIKKLTGATTVYLVVNDYWSGFEDIVVRNKKTATMTQVIGDEKNYIFKYLVP